MASWKKVIVSGSKAELAEITASVGVQLASTKITNLNNDNGLVFTDAAGTLENSTDLTYNGTTLSLASGKGIKNQSTVAGTVLTGSFTGSFKGSFRNSDGSAIEAEWDGTRDGNSQITGSGAGPSLVLSGSTGDDLLVKKDAKVEGKILSADFDVIAAQNVTLFDTVGANDLTIGASNTTVKTTLLESATSVKSADFDTIAAGAVTLFDTVGANDLTIGASNTTVKTTLLESATSVKSADFDVLTAGNVTLFDAVGDNDLTIGASTTTVILPGDRIELGNGTGDIVDVKGNLQVAGTASFNHSTNLSVTDKYILLNSGSTGTSDSGGIVVQGPNNGIGALFGFVSGSAIDSDGKNRRWGIDSGFNADSSADFTADAFMSTVMLSSVESTQDPDAANDKYKKPGNIFIDQTDGIPYIYV